jgi:hypothetical protein
MTYEKQMEWLDYQIKELEAIKTYKGKDFINSDEQIHLDALVSIKTGYQQTHKDSIELSWNKCPDRMGW